MAGYWPNSRSQIHDLNGKPLIKARAYFTLGGTTTPITTYRDSGLASAHPNPLESDGFGFFPAVFMDEADGFYNVTVTNSGGTVLYADLSIPIIGPSESGGGGSEVPVNPDSLLKTGDIVIRYGAEFRTGLVRLNGRSIGTATSGASERANSDCEQLFLYLWNLDSNIVITGGRGGSAAGDWAANKPLVLPDYRGRALIGLDTMGNTAAGVIPDADDLGWVGGARTHTLSINEMPSHDHDLTDPGHFHNWGNLAGGFGLAVGSTGAFAQTGTPPGSLNTTAATTGITMATEGGGEAHNNVQPSKAITVYMKL